MNKTLINALTYIKKYKVKRVYNNISIALKNL